MKKKEKNYKHFICFIFLIDKNVFDDNDFQSMFVDQPTFSTSELKKNTMSLNMLFLTNQNCCWRMKRIV